MSTSGISINLSGSTASSGTGIGTGIDVTSVVNQILDSERGPEKIWQQQQADLTLQATELNTINSSVSALQDSVTSLKDILGALAAKTATSSQTGIVTATAQTSAASGTHTIVVSNLAKTAAYYSDPITTSSMTFATGAISLQVGTATPTIMIDQSNNTLDGLSAYINKGDFGVSASVINDANGARLALVSKTTGLAGDITVLGNTSGLVLHESSQGKDASFTMDGVPLSSASNTVTSVLPGVTLNLVSEAPTTPVQITVGPDTTKATQAVNDFVSAYNTVISSINAQFTVNTATNTEGPLASNSALRSLQASLLSDVTYAMDGNNGYVNLSSLGINMANDGTLSVDNSKLSDVLSNHYSDFQNFFQATTVNSFGSHFGSDLANLTDPTQGVLGLSLSENASVQKMLTSQIADFEDRLAHRQQDLIKQYSQVDAALRQYPLLLAQITGQLASMQTK